MELTQEQYELLAPELPKQRGNVVVENIRFINAILYIAENGCKWRGLPKHFGNWQTVYKRANRWFKSGALERLFLALQKKMLVTLEIKILALDSTSIKVHPNAAGALKKTADSPLAKQGMDGTPSFLWCPRMIKL